MDLASHDAPETLTTLWAAHAAAMAEADERQARGGDPGAALARAFKIADQMDTVRAQTLHEAALRLEIALQHVEIAYADGAPIWLRLRRAFNEVRERAAA